MKCQGCKEGYLYSKVGCDVIILVCPACHGWGEIDEPAPIKKTVVKAVESVNLDEPTDE